MSLEFGRLVAPFVERGVVVGDGSVLFKQQSAAVVEQRSDGWRVLFPVVPVHNCSLHFGLRFTSQTGSQAGGTTSAFVATRVPMRVYRKFKRLRDACGDAL